MSQPHPSNQPSGRGALFAGGLAAILASTCCLGPLVLLSLGSSGAWISNLTLLEPYRPMFIGAALIALFFAWRRLFRPAAACKPGEVCPITVHKALTAVSSVQKVSVDEARKDALVTFDDAKTNVEALIKATTDAGYPSVVSQ